MVGDSVIAAVSVVAGYWLRYGNADQTLPFGPYLAAIPVVVAIYLFSLAVTGQYRSWRGRTLVDQLFALYSGVGLAAVLMFAAIEAANLGQRYATGTAGEPEVSQLVGMAVERIALGKMEPNSPYGGNGQTVQDRINQLAQQNAALKNLNQQIEPLFPTMSDQDWISYKDRWRVFGEEAAMRWVLSKYGQK